MNNNIRNNPRYNNVQVIDLFELFRAILKKWYLIIFCMILGGGLGFFYSTLFVKPIYSSTAQVYLRGNSDRISLESLSLSTRLAADYEVIFTSRPNVQAVINNLGLEQSVKQIQNSITITNIENTRILKITAIANSPETAKDIANGIMEQGMDSVREIDSQEPYVVEKAIANPNRINSGMSRYIMLGGMLGAIFMGGIITLLFVMNDHIQSREDIENYIGIPVLSTVLEVDSMKKSKRK